MGFSDWSNVTIESLLNSGAIVGHKDGNHGSQYPRVDEFGSVGIPFLTAKLLDAGTIDFESAPRLPENKAAKLRIGFVQSSDVLLSHNATVGRVALIPEFKGTLLIGTSLTYFRTDPNKLSPRYLAAYMAGSDFQNQLAAVMSQTTRNQVPITAQRKLRIVVPPIEDQHRISHILGGLDDKIEVNRRMNATLESMARVLFQSWFVDFDPVKRNAEASASRPEDPMFPDSFETSLLGDIPSGWNATTLGDVLDVLETGRRPKGGVAGYSSGIPSIGAESIWGIGKFDYSKTKYVPTEFYEKTSAGRVEHNDVLLYKDGGKPGEFRPRVGLFGHGFPFEKFSINEHVFRMRSGSVGQIFLYFAVSDQRVLDDFANKGGKAAIPGINQVDVRSTRILMPDKRVLEEFNRQVTPWCGLMIQNAIQSRTLANLRDALLPKLLSGELAIDQPFQGKEGIAVCQ